ncbi:hypothetical protein B0H11DRAFT_524983 [Mycena galericulata]|nr:hypothetical protein B0H11DRAFT_524983 [Mycena galericulata]
MAQMTIDRLGTLAALTVTYSTHLDPRHLEYFVYPALMKSAQATISSGTNCIHVACQHPVWVSAKPPPAAQADGGDASFRTEADGSAEGVIIDVATIFIKLGIHRAADIPEQYLQKPPATLLRDVIEDKFQPHPRFFSVDSVQATSMWEAKHGPLRHPKTLKDFVVNLHGILTSARQQSMDQAMYLFSCPRYGDQDKTYLVATAGEYLSFRLYTRADAVKIFANSGRKWKRTESEAKYVLVSDVDDRVEAPPEWDHPDEQASNDLVDPEKAKVTKEQQDKARADRYERLLQSRADAATLQALKVLKSGPERSRDLFSDEDINEFWKGYAGVKREPLMETRTATNFFAKEKGWSGLVRAGTALGDTYIQELFNFHEQLMRDEEERRQNTILR